MRAAYLLVLAALLFGLTLPPAEAQMSHLTGAYYSGSSLSGAPVMTRDDGPAINFNWTGSPPIQSTDPGGAYSVRWTGTFTPSVSGTYSFTTTADDGVRLWVGSMATPLIDDWVAQAATPRTTTIVLAQGQAYPIKMEYFENGQQQASISLAYTAPAGHVLSAPSILSIAPGNRQATLTWQPNGYWNSTLAWNLYRSDNPAGGDASFQLIQSNLNASYSLPMIFNAQGLTNGHAYAFKVSALVGGVESPLSAPAAATPLLSAPGLAAEPYDTKVILTWSDAPNAASFNLYRGLASGQETLYQMGLTGSAFDDFSVSNGTTYFYKLTAVNVNPTEESAFSTEASATPNVAAPAAPVLRGSVTGTLVSLSWTPSSGAITYSVYRDNSLIDSGLTSTTCMDAGLTPNVTYRYFVIAQNAGSVSPKSNILPLTPAPPAPTGLTATGGLMNVALVWNGSTGATSYNVKRRTQYSGYSYLGMIYSTGFTDTNVTGGVAYTYVVTANTQTSESAPSNEATATPTAPPAPPAPTGLTTYTIGATFVGLTWNVSPSATTYTLKRSQTKGGPYTPVITFGGQNYYTDQGLTTGTTYYYVVTASNQGGESGPSNEVSATLVQSPDFSLTVVPNTLHIPYGTVGSATLTLTALGGFSGPVTLTLAGMPKGAAFSLTDVDTGKTGSNTLAVTLSGTKSVTLTVQAPNSGTPQQARLTFTATSGKIAHAAQAMLIMDNSPAVSLSTVTKFNPNPVARNVPTLAGVAAQVHNLPALPQGASYVTPQWQWFPASITMTQDGKTWAEASSNCQVSFSPTFTTDPTSKAATMMTVVFRADGYYKIKARAVCIPQVSYQGRIISMRPIIGEDMVLGRSLKDFLGSSAPSASAPSSRAPQARLTGYSTEASRPAAAPAPSLPSTVIDDVVGVKPTDTISLTATSGNGQVTLNWKVSGGIDPNGPFFLMREAKLGANGQFDPADADVLSPDVHSTSYVDKNFKGEDTYYYEVYFKPKTSSGTTSNVASATAFFPSIPVQFREAAPASGFDDSGITSDFEDKPKPGPNPKWLIVPVGGHNTMLAKISATVNFKTVGFKSNQESVATVDPKIATSALQTVTVYGHQSTNEAMVNALDQTGKHLDTAHLFAVKPKPITIAFHFVSDTAHHHTSRNKADVPALVSVANQIWNKQGAVTFSLRSVDSFTYPSNLDGQADKGYVPDANVGTLFNWAVEHKSISHYVTGAWNVYCVWYYEYSPTHQIALAGTSNLNTIFGDNADGQSLAHEGGHMLGLSNDDPNPHSKDPDNLMYASATNIKIRKYQVDIVQRAGKAQ